MKTPPAAWQIDARVGNDQGCYTAAERAFRVAMTTGDTEAAIRALWEATGNSEAAFILALEKWMEGNEGNDGK